jgi:N-acetylglucosamine transport system permease protein
MSLRPRTRRNLFIAGYLGPALLTYLVFVGYPLIQTFFLSLYSWRGVSENKKFVGLRNYELLAKDPIVHKVAFNQIAMMVLATILIIGFAVAMAHALRRRTFVAKVTEVLLLTPQVLSVVITSTVFVFMLNPKYGIVSNILNAVGFKYDGGVLGNEWGAKIVILVAFVWNALGFYVLLFGAGLKSIDEEVLEAAQLDGAGGWKLFKNVTWPLLWSVKKVAVVYVVSNVMGIFALVTFLTNGGPGDTSNMLLNYVQRLGFDQTRFGRAVALAVLGFFFAMIVGWISNLAIGKDPTKARKSAVTG